MLKIRIESTNPLIGNQIDFCEVCEADKTSVSSSTEFVHTFVRAMLGSGFNLDIILLGMKDIIEFYESTAGLEELEENN
jgi:hypothetical protein